MQPVYDIKSMASSMSGFEQLTAFALLEATSDAVYLIDEQRRILCWSQGAAALYGWSVDEALGQQVDLLLFNAENNQFEEALDALKHTNTWTGEHQQVTCSGRELLVQSRWTMVPGTQESDYFLVVNSDITQKKALELHMLRAQRLESLGTLASGIAHDMNNILGPILMSINMLESEPEGEQRELLSFLEASTRRGIALMEQMVSFARGASGVRQIVEVIELMEEVEQLFCSSLPDSIEVNVAMDQEVWQVSGNVTQLHQVVMNLCVNARDALEETGQIRIRVRNVVLEQTLHGTFSEVPAGSYVQIVIADTGVGIPADTIEKIFEPFFSTKETGTGLGLSTTLGILNGHDGFIDVESRPGAGTTFRLYLPALKELPKARVTKILVVDDDRYFREALVMLLTDLGFEAMDAGNVEMGQVMAVESAPDLVLCDLRMGKDRGDQFLASLKAEPQTSHLPVVLMTGNLEAALAINFKPDYYLLKPFTVNEVVKMLDAMQA